jgi:hypothetical protein
MEEVHVIVEGVVALYPSPYLLIDQAGAVDQKT